MTNINQQTGNENIQTYQVEAVILIWHQVLLTNLQGKVTLLEGRINNQILGVKGLNHWRIFHLTLLLPKVMKTEFLLTISIQYQPESDENEEKY